MKTTGRLFRRWVTAILSFGFTLLVALFALYLYIYLQLPDVNTLNNVQMSVPLRIYTADGKLIAEFGEERRSPVSIQDVPKPLILALLSTEDQRYYDHPGVDFIGLARATLAVVSSGRKSQGASTITMQVARNFFLSAQKTYSRKINEILLAIKIESNFSKEKILELYLNKVYLGHRAYGVASAAEMYFGKSLNKLTLAEMAMIAGLPQAPSRDNPISNPDAAIERRNHVLERMYENGHIDKKAYLTAIKAPNTASVHDNYAELKAPYVAEMVRAALFDMYDKEAYSMGLKVYTTIDSQMQMAANKTLERGLLDYTHRHGYLGPVGNLGRPKRGYKSQWAEELAEQPIVNDLLPAAVIEVRAQSARVLLENGKTVVIPWSGLAWAKPNVQGKFVGAAPQSASDILVVGDVIYVQPKGDSWELSQLPQVEGALVSMSPRNGAILALNGGFSYDRSHFNRVTQAKRQPGSSFKPFIYSAALAKGYTLASLVDDAPLVTDNSNPNAWNPHNVNNRFYGPTRLRTALTNSRNLVSIRLLREIGLGKALSYLHRFGFNDSELPRNLTLALGSGEVTPLELSTAYAVFANGGYRIKPYFIDRIENDAGEVLYKEYPQTVCENCLQGDDSEGEQKHHHDAKFFPAPQVITPQNAYLITNVLQNVITNGTAKRALVLNRKDIAGKTGTTNDQFDTWFAGYNQNIVTIVWVGNDNPQSIHEFGAELALPIWIDFMRTPLSKMPEQKWEIPPGLVNVRIDPESGLLASANQINAVTEWFEQKNVPKEGNTQTQQALNNDNAAANTQTEAEIAAEAKALDQDQAEAEAEVATEADHQP